MQSTYDLSRVPYSRRRDALPATANALLAAGKLAATLARFTLGARSGASDAEAEQRAHRTARSLARQLGLAVHHVGQPHADAQLLVANHRSYLDPLALLHGGPCSLLAKAEVGSWPLVGAACRAAGTTFVQRERKESRSAARHALTVRAASGGRVALFPEGTTTAGPGCLPFRPGMFHAAAEANLAVQPVAIHAPSPDVAYVEGHHFGPHFLRLFRAPHVSMFVAWGPVLRGNDGAQLCAAAERWVDGALAELAAARPVVRR